MLALTMIVKDDKESEDLERCLASVAKFVDKIYVTTTNHPSSKIKSIVEAYKGKLSHFDWNHSFSDARNFSFNQVDKKYEYILWLDADDTVSDPQNLKAICERMKKENVVHGYLKYDYDRSAENIERGDHWKPRLIKNDGKNIWQKPVHENLVREDQFLQENYTESYVIHNYKPELHFIKELRNYNLLLHEYESNPENCDPRTLHYLGKSSLGLAAAKEITDKASFYKQAIHFFQGHIKKSGWPEESYFSYTHMGLAYMQMGHYDSAKNAFLKAIEMFPEWADAYWYMCMIEDGLEHIENAIAWGETALTKKMPETVLAVNKELYELVGPGTLATCYTRVTRTKEALAIVSILPDCEQVSKLKKEIMDRHNLEESVKGTLSLLKYTLLNDENNFEALVENLPDYVMKDIRVQSETIGVIRPKVWPKKSIVFYCGKTVEEWADPAVMTGIGGSEEATIYMAREFAKLGYEVTVYNSCGKMKGKYNGVNYVPYYRFNPKDFFEWLVVWRQPIITMHTPNAKKLWLWNHDYVDNSNFNEEIINRVDKFVFLSKWQRQQATDIPEEKVIYSSNGLNVGQIRYAIQHSKRRKNRIIYASSYDRGLEHILTRWSRIRKEVPDAELRIFYGWETFDKARTDEQSLIWKSKMVELMKQPGIYHGGRIGQQELCNEFAEANIWLYPCHFWEINCITALRAQAAGAIPFTTDFAALGETVQFGFRATGVKENMVMPPHVADILIKEAIKALKFPMMDAKERSKAEKYAQEKYDWSEIIKSWTK